MEEEEFQYFDLQTIQKHWIPNSDVEITRNGMIVA